MDGFAVDLDKVLDDFEESEDIVPPSSGITPGPPSYFDVAQVSTSAFSHSAVNTPSSVIPVTEEVVSDTPRTSGRDENVTDLSGTGIFDVCDGAHIDQNVHRLKQMGIGEYGTPEVYKPNGDEGHFIPDDVGQDVTHGPYGYDPGIYNTQSIGLSEPFSNEHLFETANSQEILQAASELQAHIGGKEDRPSFMSSSPPLSSFHHPDIIPSSCSTDSSQASNENQSDSGVSSEQGETGITNTYINTSPVHRSNPDEASNMIHSLEDIAQNSYTIPSAVSHNTYQLPSDICVNDNNLSSLKAGSENISGAQNSFYAGAGDTDKTFSQLLPSNSAEQESVVTMDTGVAHSECAQVDNSDQYETTRRDPVCDTSLVENATQETSVQENVGAGTNRSEKIDSSVQDFQDTHEAKEVARPVGNEPVNSTMSDNVGVTSFKNISENFQDSKPSSIQAYPEVGCNDSSLGLIKDSLTSDVSDTEQLKESAAIPSTSDINITEHQQQNENVTETVNESKNEPKEIHVISRSDLIETKPSEICDRQDLRVLDKFIAPELSLSADGYATVMSEAESELAELEQNITMTKDEVMPNLANGNQNVDAVNSTASTAIPTQSCSSSSNSVVTDHASTHGSSVQTSSTATCDRPTQLSNVDSSSSLTSPASPDVPAEELKRRDSGESVERFLAPAVMSPGIATPMDDPGFSKVPGYQPALDSMTEEDEQSVSKALSSSLAGDGAINDVRPKESTPERSRKNRPNSLLGLSKPDLPPARVVQEGGSNQATENSSVNLLYEFSNAGQLQNSPNVDDVVFEISAEEKAMSDTSMSAGDLMSPVLDNSQIQIDSHDILRPKSILPPQTLPGVASGCSNPPASLNLTFPNSNIQNPPRPASWPGQDTPQETQKQRRPNSLNIPSRGGSVSPSQSMQPSPLGSEIPEIAGVGLAPPRNDAVVVANTVTPEVDNASEAMEGAVAAEPVAAHSDVSSSSASGDSLITIPTVMSPGRTPGTALPPQSSSNPLLSITDLGKIAPTWIPDADAPNCMECDLKFTFTRRRHHCRACGKVFCSNCCYLKSKLQYMDNKEARVCSKCYQDLIRAVVFERMSSEEGATGGGSCTPSPNPNNPSEYCSTIPPLQQAQANLNAPPPSVMVPVGVLRKEGSLKRESKQVMFSDGIRPGGDLTELDGSADVSYPVPRPSSRRAKKVERSSDSQSSKGKGKSVKPMKAPSVTTCYVPQSGLPPIFKAIGSKGEFIMENCNNIEATMAQVNASNDPVHFVVNKNLLVLVKLVTMDCCVHRTCWCFTSKGMCTVGQDEIVILLECFPNEECLPVDIFQHFHTVYEEASKGRPVSNMDHTIFKQGFLDSRDHGGFLYLRPTFQCLNKLIIPEAPYVFGILLQKWETPWAKVFPVRLLLRLGAEFRYYPCPLVSVRFRKPVFGEIGHTIMNLLVDFRNFQYVIPHVRGFSIYMKDKKTFLNLPRNRYDDVTRALSSSTDQVLALAANFSKEADSYLVCIQNEDGNYQTQAINIHNKPRQVTGASFVVFNANLKTSGGIHAKSSIVEDGIMVQILPETMMQLCNAMKDMRDYCIEYGGVNPSEPEESVVIQWVDNDKDFNVGVASPIDNFPMDGVPDVHIHNAVDYVGEANKAIRWTQVFFLQTNEENTRIEPVDLSRLAETLSTALSLALTPKLDKLSEAGLFRIGLRARIDSENVGYEVGSKGEKLPDFYMNDLDNELIPVIHNAAAQNRDGAVIMELIFHIINT